MVTLREVRVNAEITITDLAKEAGLSRFTIEKMEARKAVRAISAVAAARALSTLTGTTYTFQDLNILILEEGKPNDG